MQGRLHDRRPIPGAHEASLAKRWRRLKSFDGVPGTEREVVQLDVVLTACQLGLEPVRLEIGFDGETWWEVGAVMGSLRRIS